MLLEQIITVERSQFVRRSVFRFVKMYKQGIPFYLGTALVYESHNWDVC